MLVRVTVGVEAHTHEFIATAHEDQKFGFSLAGGEAAEAVRAGAQARRQLDLVGLHSHIGSQIFDTSGFEVAAHRVVGLLAAIRDEHGVELPELDLGGGLGIAYTSEDDPATPRRIAAALRGDRGARVRGCRARDVRGSRSSRAARSPGPPGITLYEVGTVKPAATGLRTLRLGRRRHERQHPHRALRRGVHRARWSRAPRTAAPMLAPGGRQALRVRRHRGPGRLAARRPRARRPARGGRDRRLLPSMASTTTTLPRPPVVAVRDGAARVLVRRETEEDLLALDLG